MVDKKEFNKIENVDKSNLYDSLENLNCIVFFIRENHSRSYLFELAKKQNKFIILVKLDNFDEDYGNYRCVKMNIPIDHESNKEALKHFQSLLRISLKLKKQKPKDFSSSCYHIFSSENTLDSIQIEIKKITNNEIIISQLSKGSCIVNLSTNAIISIQPRLCEYCWIDHLDKMLVRNHNSLLLCDRFQNESKIIMDDFKDDQFSRSFVVYLKTNKKTYIYSNQKFLIYDKHFILEHVKEFENNHYFNMQASNGKIFLINSDSIDVIDLNINILKRLNVKSNAPSNIQFDCDYAYMSTMYNIQIIDMEKLNIIGFIDTDKTLLMVFNGYLLFEATSLSGYRNYLQVYKLNFRKNQNNSNYICKFTLFENQHLYSNPYVLPCGASACLDCIYEHLDIENNLTCYVCSEKHSISPQFLEKSSDIETILFDKETIKSIFERGELVMDGLGLFFYEYLVFIKN
jgi:hypothetical protein